MGKKKRKQKPKKPLKQKITKKDRQFGKLQLYLLGLICLLAVAFIIVSVD